MPESIAGEITADKRYACDSSELLAQGEGKNECEIGPHDRKDEMNGCVETVSFPQRPVVNEPLKKQPRPPENRQAGKHKLSQLRRRRRREQCVRIEQTEYSHQDQ